MNKTPVRNQVGRDGQIMATSPTITKAQAKTLFRELKAGSERADRAFRKLLSTRGFLHLGYTSLNAFAAAMGQQSYLTKIANAEAVRADLLRSSYDDNIALIEGLTERALRVLVATRPADRLSVFERARRLAGKVGDFPPIKLTEKQLRQAKKELEEVVPKCAQKITQQIADAKRDAENRRAKSNAKLIHDTFDDDDDNNSEAQKLLDDDASPIASSGPVTMEDALIELDRFASRFLGLRDHLKPVYAAIRTVKEAEKRRQDDR